MSPAPCEFRPLPGLTNPHVQTILASVFKGLPPSLPRREEIVRLHDGDGIVLHDMRPPAWPAGGVMVLLVHGLGGHYSSPYIRRVSHRLARAGLGVVAVDLRGSGRGERHARKIYNGACSPDLRAALASMRRWDPDARFIVVGFSLGGNITLRLGCEAAGHPVPGLLGVAAVAPPIDMEECSRLISLPENRFYDWHFVQTLTRLVRQQQRHFPDLPRATFTKRMTLREFDDVYTAPRGGFASALDYYRRASAGPLIDRMAVPALLLTARDDPFIAAKPFEVLPRQAHVQVEITRYGGHLGFLGFDGTGGVRWAERRVVDWVCQLAKAAGQPGLR